MVVQKRLLALLRRMITLHCQARIRSNMSLLYGAIKALAKLTQLGISAAIEAWIRLISLTSLVSKLAYRESQLRISRISLR